MVVTESPLARTVFESFRWQTFETYRRSRFNYGVQIMEFHKNQNLDGQMLNY